MVLAEFLKEWNNPSESMLVHTSGSTGAPKLLWIEKQRMVASARMTCDFLNLKPGDTALLCMSLNHIAGKMMVVRSLVRDLKLIEVPPSTHPLRDVNQEIVFAAMVPMQVYSTLQVAEEREKLRHIKHLIIGGGAVEDTLEQQLKDFPHAVWSSYGMTETLSHIALRRLNGPTATQWYTPLPGIHTALTTDNRLIITAPHLCAEPLITNDIAEVAPSAGNLSHTPSPSAYFQREKDKGKTAHQVPYPSLFRILGRRDNVIVCGGIKIRIEEVEQMLRPHLPVPYLITKRKDEKFGEIVVLLYVPPTHSGYSFEAEQIRSVCLKHLPKYWQPRLYIPIPSLPLTETGKLKRKEAEVIAAQKQIT